MAEHGGNRDAGRTVAPAPRVGRSKAPAAGMRVVALGGHGDRSGRGGRRGQRMRDERARDVRAVALVERAALHRRRVGDRERDVRASVRTSHACVTVCGVSPRWMIVCTIPLGSTPARGRPSRIEVSVC
jgi:hypothetical protein